MGGWSRRVRECSGMSHEHAVEPSVRALLRRTTNGGEPGDGNRCRHVEDRAAVHFGRRGRTLTHRAAGSLVLALLLLVITAASVSAKLDATVSPDRARPGDTVTLTTGSASEGVSQGGQPVPMYLLAGIDDRLYDSCPFYDAPSAKAAGATLLGFLSWDHTTGVGTLAFRVPDVPPGSHAIAVLAPNASPGCWPEAILTVIAPPAADLSWLLVAAAAAVAAVAAVVGGLWRRRPSAR